MVVHFALLLIPVFIFFLFPIGALFVFPIIAAKQWQRRAGERRSSGGTKLGYVQRAGYIDPSPVSAVDTTTPPLPPYDASTKEPIKSVDVKTVESS